MGIVIFENESSFSVVQRNLSNWNVVPYETDINGLNYQVCMFNNKKYPLSYFNNEIQELCESENYVKTYSNDKIAKIQCRTKDQASELIMSNSRRYSRPSEYLFSTKNNFVNILSEKNFTRLQSFSGPEVLIIKNNTQQIKIKLENKNDPDGHDLLINVGQRIEALTVPTFVYLHRKYFTQAQKMISEWEDKFFVSLKIDKYNSLLNIYGFYDDREKFQVAFKSWTMNDPISESQIEVKKKKLLQTIDEYKDEIISSDIKVKIDYNHGIIYFQSNNTKELTKTEILINKMVGVEMEQNKCEWCGDKSSGIFFQFCGHYNCSSCILQAGFNEKKFMHCNCGDPMSLADIRGFFNYHQLVSQVFKKFVGNNNNYFFCSSGCNYVFKETSNNKTCPYCNSQN